LGVYSLGVASAKPTLKERDGVKHFGLDIIYPNDSFDVTLFIKLYKEAKTDSIKEGKSLVIVGGTSFYLKSLIQGLSPMPTISSEIRKKSLQTIEQGVIEAYDILFKVDSDYMQNIASTDSYRIEKMLNLYYQTGLTPTEYFRANPPQPTIIEPLPIYEIQVDKEILREKIKERTQKMKDMGLVEEVAYLEKSYTREPNCMKAIGIKEVLDYFDGVYSFEQMQEKIVINTARLAKRQRKFNRSQFDTIRVD